MNKKLYKSRNDRALSGVCAGIAEYFDIDVVIARLLAVIFCFISFGTFLIAYIVAAIIIPEEPMVRTNDGKQRTVYETTYEYRSEDGTVYENSAAGPGPSGGGSTGSTTGGAEFYTGSEAGTGNGSSQARSTESEDDFVRQESRPVKKNSGSWIVGVVLIAMGAYLILDWFFPFISWRIFGAAILILLGFVVLVRK